MPSHGPACISLHVVQHMVHHTAADSSALLCMSFSHTVAGNRCRDTCGLHAMPSTQNGCMDVLYQSCYAIHLQLPCCIGYPQVMLVITSLMPQTCMAPTGGIRTTSPSLPPHKPCCKAHMIQITPAANPCLAAPTLIYKHMQYQLQIDTICPQTPRRHSLVKFAVIPALCHG